MENFIEIKGLIFSFRSSDTFSTFVLLRIFLFIIIVVGEDFCCEHLNRIYKKVKETGTYIRNIFHLQYEYKTIKDRNIFVP